MNVTEIDAAGARALTPGTTAHPMFPARWSPRAFSGAPVNEAQVLTLVEAARWAPSCFNAQPWRFAYAIRDTVHWQPLFDCLVEGNQVWAANAGVLIAVISRTEYEHNGRPGPTHAFDAGAAWMSLALQARHMGLYAHGMLGFDQHKLRAALSVPEVYFAPAVIAVGYPGEVDALPESVRAREVPSGRKALTEIAFAGSFATLDA